MATKTRPEPTVLEQQMIEALAELRGARLDMEHCPSADNERTVIYAERRLDLLFARRKATQAMKEAR